MDGRLHQGDRHLHGALGEKRNGSANRRRFGSVFVSVTFVVSRVSAEGVGWGLVGWSVGWFRWVWDLGFGGERFFGVYWVG